MQRAEQWEKITKQVKGYFSHTDNLCHTCYVNGKLQPLSKNYISLSITLAYIKSRWPKYSFIYHKDFKSTFLDQLNQIGIRRVSVEEAKKLFNTRSVLLKQEESFNEFKMYKTLV